MALFISVGVTLNIGLIGLFLTARDEAMAAAIAYVIAGVSAVATVVYLFNGSAAVMAVTEIAIGVIGVLGAHLALGGYSWSGGWLAWGLSHVTVVALFFGRVAAFTLVSIYLGSAITFVFLEPILQGLRDGPPDVMVPAVLAADMVVVNLVLLATLASMLVSLLSREQSRNLELLLNVLPSAIVARLRDTPGVIADRFDECTVAFADIVGFTPHSATVTPDRLVEELNSVFSRFDDLVARFGVEKIKTIGDGYMVIAGAPVARDHHVAAICDLALAMQGEMPDLNQRMGTDFLLRIGINTGQVVAGVIGTSKFSYDLWGDTVNVASRLEGNADPGTILVSQAVADEAGSSFSFLSLGDVALKGKGPVPVFRLQGRTDVQTRV
jgi:class 3 adenylate cyclase